MKLIPNVEIEPFYKIAWVSQSARTEWEQVIRDASMMIQNLEVVSVERGQRPCSWQTIREDQFSEYSIRWAEKGIVSIPVKRVGNFKGFAHKHLPVKPGEIALLCVILVRDLKDALKYMDAFKRNDNVVQGELLGFPKCCSEFFEKNWKGGFFDPMWQTAENTLNLIGEATVLRMSAHPFSNPLLRYGGIRIGFHIPCSFSCEKTISSGQERYDLGCEFNRPLMEKIKFLLSMPMSWNCYHGVAEIRTPIFYMVSSSVPAVEKCVVEIEGSEMPAESVAGGVFPFSEVPRE